MNNLESADLTFRKLLLGFIACFLIYFSTFSQKVKDPIPVGNVVCRTKGEYLDSARKAYGIYYSNDLINKSDHLIDIWLSTEEFPFAVTKEARLYWDTSFKLYYVTSTLTGDNKGSSKVDTTYPPKSLSLDSLFSRLVEEGIFNLPLVSTDSLTKASKASKLSKDGKFMESSTEISDGDNYIVTFKVGNCYGQYIFDNPDVYSNTYIDNFIFKRQAAIVDIIMSGYKRQ